MKMRLETLSNTTHSCIQACFLLNRESQIVREAFLLLVYYVLGSLLLLGRQQLVTVILILLLAGFDFSGKARKGIKAVKGRHNMGLIFK